MTRPLVHLREQVRSERCSWGVINMENGREDRLRLGEEDEPGRRSGGRKRRTSGRQTAIRRERTRQQKKRRVMMRLFLCLFIFLLGAGTGWTLRGKMIRKLIDPSTIEMPNWVDEQLTHGQPIFQTGDEYSGHQRDRDSLCGKSWDDGTAEP